MANILASFVYELLDFNGPIDNEYPCLLKITNKKKNIFSYPILKNPIEFKNNKFLVGQLPLTNKSSGGKNRLGFSGLTQDKTYYYASSFNSIYQIRKKNLSLKKIISNQLMSDMHGIQIHKKKLFHVLTGLDTVVITNLDGSIIDFFTITKRLNILRDQSLLKNDWRFIHKKHKGASGFFHINFISVNDSKIWLTSRNLNSFIVVDLDKNSVELRTMNMMTTSLIHDGIHIDKSIYLTSVNGKIIEVLKKKEKKREQSYKRDLIIRKITNIDKNIIKGTTNWCRGIEIKKNRIFVMINGRYETRPEFSILEVNKKKMKLINRHTLSYKKLSMKFKLRYLTGFDILVD